MDERIPGHVRGREVRISLDGRAIRAHEGETVGASLHASGIRVLSRSLKYHRPRGLFCMTGKCANCMMRVDGVPNVRVCTTMCRDGMRIESQNALPSVQFDLLRASDVVFPRSFDYHDKFIRPRFLTPVYHWFIRRMAGYGRIPPPPRAPPTRPPIRVLSADVLVAGGGAAGLAAALAASEAGARVLLFEESRWLGGDLALVDAEAAKAAERELRATPADVRTDAPVVGVYPGPDGATVVARTGEGLVEVRASSLVVATGTHETPPLFPGNDLPGILGARAGLVLAERFGVLPGRRVAILGESPLGSALAEHLRALDVATERLPPDAVVRKALGRRAIRGLVVATGGETRRVACDALCVAAGESPRPELLQQAGARLVYREEDGGLVPEVDADGRTSVPGVVAAGSAARRTSPHGAFAHGRRAGRAAAMRARAAEAPA